MQLNDLLNPHIAYKDPNATANPLDHFKNYISKTVLTASNTSEYSTAFQNGWLKLMTPLGTKATLRMKTLK